LPFRHSIIIINKKQPQKNEVRNPHKNGSETLHKQQYKERKKIDDCTIKTMQAPFIVNFIMI
jgi:hypothetical protein